MMNYLLEQSAGGLGSLFSNPKSIAMTVVYVLVFVGIVYFMMIRPSQKQQKEAKSMQESMEVGDLIVTTSGFYGEIIDVSEDDIIVEFGSNKNCRIPMKKSAVAELEKKEK